MAAMMFVGKPVFFATDRELISSLGRLETEQDVDEELEFYNARRPLHWTKSRIRLRVSTRRLRYVATSCLRLAAMSRSGRLAV
jgi:hypothetical protein